MEDNVQFRKLIKMLGNESENPIHDTIGIVYQTVLTMCEVDIRIGKMNDSINELKTEIANLVFLNK